VCLCKRADPRHFCSPPTPDSLSTAHDGVALNTQVVGQVLFHLNGMLVRHRVQMLVHLRQQSNTIFPDQSGRLVPVLVIFKSMIDRQAGHSNVDSRLGRIALWIMPQNRPILQRSFGQQNDVNVMMEFRFGRSKPSAFTTTHSMTLHLGPAYAKLYQLSLSSGTHLREQCPLTVREIKASPNATHLLPQSHIGPFLLIDVARFYIVELHHPFKAQHQ
jgi:hypothetical protein